MREKQEVLEEEIEEVQNFDENSFEEEKIIDDSSVSNEESQY